MANIPRRKIYEVMLEFEEHVLEIQILIQSEQNFKEYYEQYSNSLKNAGVKYEKIKALLMMFFENEKFETEEEFEGKLKYYLANRTEVDAFLKKEKNLNKHFRKIIADNDELFANNDKIKDLEHGVELFFELDMFNTAIPKILEIRRDRMK